MKKGFLIFSLLLLGSLIFIITNCEKDPAEYCEQDEICTDKFVTVCCTEDQCVYKYNGNEYPDSNEGRDQLAEALGCPSTKSTSYENDMTAIIIQLQELMDKVHELYLGTN